MKVSTISESRFIPAGFEKRVEEARRQLSVVSRDRAALLGMIILAAFIFLGVFGPSLAPYDPVNDFVREDGDVLRLTPPSDTAPLGTTQFGKDVFSQFLAGARPTMIAGFVGGLFGSGIGFVVGVLAGYYGGWVDEVLMRLTDLTFAVPALPLALVVLSFVSPNIYLISLVITVVIWKMSARIIRSEAMAVNERTFVKSAHASGASNLHTMVYHITPNVLPIGFLYAAYSIAWAIVFQASLAFLGFGDPTTTSWGRMLRTSFQAGVLRDAWWWTLPPTLGIAAVTVSVFFIGRAYEEVINPEIGDG